MRLTILTIFLVLSLSKGRAQHYGYALTSGWQAEYVLQTDSGFAVFGLDNHNGQSGTHYFVQDFFSSKLVHKSSRNFPDTPKPENFYSTLSTFAYESLGGNIQIGGMYRDTSNDTLFAAVYNLSGDSLTWNPLKFGHQTFITDLVTYENQLYILGLYNSTNASNEKLRTFVKTDYGSLIADIGCDYIYPGGCRMHGVQLLPIEDGFLLTAENYSVNWRDIRDPEIVKLDTAGKVKWRLRLNNDSTSGFNIVVSPLANGNFLASYMDYQWKPNRKPPDFKNRYAALNENTTIQCVEFNKFGQIIRQYDLRDELRFIGHYRSIKVAHHNHMILTQDSSIVIVGNTEDLGTNGNYLGYILKLDKHGNYQWFRQLELNINGSPGKEEELYINGVTELKNGAFALAGEYRSQFSDSFPTGIQSGVVILTDEFGCMKPGCELTDNIQHLNRSSNLVKIYPNPSIGLVHLEPLQNTEIDFEIQNSLGQLIQDGSFNGLFDLILPKGLIFIHLIDKSTGNYQVQKVLVH